MGPFRHSRPSAPAEQASSHMADNIESMRTMDDTGPELYDSFRIGEEDTVLNEIERGSPLPARPPPEQDSEADEFDVADNRVLSRFKWALLVVTAILGAAAATSPFIYSRSQESDAFKQSFDNDATHFVEAFYLQQTNTLWALSSLASNYKSLAAYSTTNFPNVTMSDIHNQGLPSLHFSESDSIFFAPMLTSSSDQKSWEQYAVQNQRLAGISYKGSFRPIEQGVFRLNGTNQIMDDQYDDFPKLPIWQIMPSKFRRHANLFNIMSLSSIPNAIWLNGFDRGPFFSPFLEQHEANFLSGTMASDPRSVVLLPILQNDEIVGAVGEEVNWTKCFDNVIHDGAEVQIVLYNSCGQVHTYQVKEGKAFHIGEGELLKYGDQYLDMSRGVSLSEMKSFLLQEQVWYQSNEDLPSQNFSEHQLLEGQDSCMYYIVVHPTTEYEAAFRTVFPVASCLVSMGGAILLLALFGTFTVLVQRRERQVLNSAAKSHAIIKSLFPAVVRDRLFGLRSMHRNNKPQASFSRRRSIQLMPIKDSLTDLGPGSARNRLSNFLTASTDLGDFTEGDEAEPIAEMFSATTILFADIAGFTAWSSEREPSQVFTLLETLYHEFDMIAKRLNVFKVETIGDCYVAVSGLPEPNDDHAKVMSRFAYEILLATSHLTQHLESTLGPGTSELGLRIGLHSGSVTAGVLRGAKSRFQLFGDTMNTASRMESTGIEGKIQVSEATADLISRAGKSHWLTPREELVSVKGKGEMQTYWLMIRRASNRSLIIPDEESVSNEADREDQTSQIDYDAEPQLPVSVRESRAWGRMGGDDLSLTSRFTIFAIKEERLVEWNAEVLMSFLEKVVQHRFITESKNSWSRSAQRKPRRVENLREEESGLVIDEVVEIINLPKFDSSLATYGNKNTKMLPPEIRAQMKEFVAAIASLYRDVPFHSFEHASHVTMSANKLMKRIITTDDLDSTGHKREKHPCPQADLHFSTFGISSDPLCQFAVVFSALIHDVDHTGYTNAQLVAEHATIAKIFRNKSVAEQNSVVVAWELLMEPRFEDLRHCIFGNEEGRRRFRQLMVNIVMATDILDSDMLSLRKSRWEKAFDPNLSIDMPLLDEDVHRKATIVIEHIIQASDVAHTMQHWHIFTRWNARLFKELYRAFINGHAEKDPAEGWYEGQLKFFDHYVIPLAQKLRECGVFGVSGDEYLRYAQANRDEWEQKGREETRKMIQLCRSSRGIPLF